MELDLELIQSFCEETLELLLKWESVCIELSKKPPTQEMYQDLFRIAHNIKGGSRAVGLTEYGEFVHRIEDGITMLRDGRLKVNSKISSLLLESQKLLSDWTIALKIQPDFKLDYQNFIENYREAFEIDSTAEIPQIDHLRPENELHSKSDTQSPAAFISPSGQIPTVAAAKSPPQNESLRIQARKLDQLLQLIGELSIHQSVIWHTKSTTLDSNRLFTNSIQLSQKLSKDIYDMALSLRMQSMHLLFQRLERNVLDISKSLKKEVSISIEGGDVELDKTVLEKIVDPLMHIVRNAIDHGIEGSNERIANGKRPIGTVSLKAHKDTFGVQITISDDGKGLRSERILEKAREKQLIRPDENLSKSEIFNLIFLPGFSTAEKVTDVSGRGVGMDVVRRSLDEIQGEIAIDSTPNEGTVFTITLPTSVNIIEAIIVKVSGDNCVLPLAAVEEVVALQECQLDMLNGMANYRNHVIPVLPLSSLIRGQIQKPNANEWPNKGTILICVSGRDKVGLLIDEILGQQQIVVRPLNENINQVFGVLGGTILGNGEPGLILDLPQIMKEYLKQIRESGRDKNRELAS